MLYKKLTENELYNNLKQISMADFLQKQTIMCCLLYNHFCWLLILKKHHFESNKTYIVPWFIVFLFYSLAILWSNFGYVEHPLSRTLFFGLVAVPLIGSQLYVIDKLSNSDQKYFWFYSNWNWDKTSHSVAKDQLEIVFLDFLKYLCQVPKWQNSLKCPQ